MYGRWCVVRVLWPAAGPNPTTKRFGGKAKETLRRKDFRGGETNSPVPVVAVQFKSVEERHAKPGVRQQQRQQLASTQPPATAMDRLGRTCSFAPLLPPSAPAFVASPQINWRSRSQGRLSFDRQHGGSRRRGIAAVAAAVEQQPAGGGGGGGGGGEGVHSEQKTGYQPPSPLEDDGYVVDLALLQDLFDSGERGTRVGNLTRRESACIARTVVEVVAAAGGR